MTAAADTDGTVLVTISYESNSHAWLGGLVVLNQDGKQIRFVDTAGFLKEVACFGPDHSIWTMGRRGDRNLVRRYSSDGKLIGSFLPGPPFLRGCSTQLALFDRGTSTWKPTDNNPLIRQIPPTYGGGWKRLSGLG